MTREHVIQTLGGARVLVEFGNGFAFLRAPFGPGIMSDPATRLNIGYPATPARVAQSPDGVFISPCHLWAILVEQAKPDCPVNVDDASKSLFWTVPDLHQRLMRLFTEYNSTESYWQGMAKSGYYDPATRFVHRVAA